MKNMLEQGPDFCCWFNKTKFSYHCVHPIHAKMFSIQMLLHFSQIAPRVCTLVLFISFDTAQVLYSIYLPGGRIRLCVFLNMYCLLCFPLVLLSSFIWQWFSKCKKRETVFIYIYIDV